MTSNSPAPLKDRARFNVGNAVDWNLAAALGGKLVRPEPQTTDYTRNQVIEQLAESARASELPVRAFVDAGKVRLLAVAAPQRLPQRPDVPTLGEAMPPLRAEFWIGLLAPSGTPDAAVARWNGPYLKNRDSLTDPWGRPYQYRAPGDHGEYDLWSLGGDGRPGGEGENADVASW